MWPFKSSLDVITESDIQALIPYVRESNRLDYKEGGYQGNSWEILKDVSAFANAAGGCIIIGVSEDRTAEDGTPGAVVGIADGDSEQRHVESVCHGNIDPPIVGLRVRDIAIGSSGRSAIVVAIPDSANKPHMISLKGKREFFSRHERQNLPMSVDEVRQSVLRTYDAERAYHELIRQREPEVLEFAQHNTGGPPTGGPSLLWMYLVPMFVGEERIDVITEAVYQFLKRPPTLATQSFYPGQSGDVIPTLEGMERQLKGDQLTRLHRTGYFDFVLLDLAQGNDQAGNPYLDRWFIQEAMYWWTRVAFECWHKFLGGEPVALSARLFNVEGTVLRLTRHDVSPVQSRSVLSLPTLRLTAEPEWRQAAKALLNRMFNAFGFPSPPDCIPETAPL